METKEKAIVFCKPRGTERPRWYRHQPKAGGPWYVHDTRSVLVRGPFATAEEADEAMEAAVRDAAARDAAPDLLAALKTALPHLHWSNIHGSRCDEAIAAVEAALANAEPERNET